MSTGTPTDRTFAPPEALLGQRLEPYEIDRLIGQGGTGIVYGAQDRTIGKRVAIKVLKPELADDPLMVKRLVSEARAVNSVSHRNVVDIFGHGQLPDGRQYLVMEYLEGESLDQYLNRRSLAINEVVRLLIEICEPLYAVHTAGVVHRDLKPSNIFLCYQPDGTRFLKLLDFGFAKHSDGSATSGQSTIAKVIGTPDYMAPELARAKGVGPPSDLYAVGVIAYQLITRSLPFRAPTAMEVIVMHATAAVPHPGQVTTGVPPALDALIVRLMAKKPGDRPASAEAVREELTRIAKGGFLDIPSALAAPGAFEGLTPQAADSEPPPRIAFWPAMFAVGAALALVVGTAHLTGIFGPPEAAAKPKLMPSFVPAGAGPMPAAVPQRAVIPPTAVTPVTPASTFEPVPLPARAPVLNTSPAPKAVRSKGPPTFADLSRRADEVEKRVRQKRSGADLADAVVWLDNFRRLLAGAESKERADIFQKKLTEFERENVPR